jgi:hypothetical protein
MLIISYGKLFLIYRRLIFEYKFFQNFTKDSEKLFRVCVFLRANQKTTNKDNKTPRINQIIS